MTGSAAEAGEERWPIIWCYDGWLERLLPPWAVLRLIDTSRPLEEQCADAKARGARAMTWGAVSGRAIERARGLRLIAQPAAGYANIDVEAARRRGVPVTTAPGSNAHSTAELALMLILMLARRADEARGAFSRRGAIGDPVGTELRGKTLGIVGMGRVGVCLAAAAGALGMEVVSVNSRSSRADLDALLAASDVVSLHVQLTQETRGMIGSRELALMRPHALLINTARGGVIDDAALTAALEEGRLGGVGLDVHAVEPADPSEPLYRHAKVLALPHCGAATEEVYDRLAQLLLHNIVAAREGGELRHRLV